VFFVGEYHCPFRDGSRGNVFGVLVAIPTIIRDLVLMTGGAFIVRTHEGIRRKLARGSGGMTGRAIHPHVLDVHLVGELEL
jgi:hypothetical protein